MYTWDYDITKINQNTEEFTIWKLERLINYGLKNEKIKEEELKKYWSKIKIPRKTRIFLKHLLWE